MKEKLQYNWTDLIFGFITKMSTDKKEKVQVTWGTAIIVLAILNLGGSFDIRRCLDDLKQIPKVLERLDAQSKEIEHIKEVLIRNKLAGPEENSISTANYK